MTPRSDSAPDRFTLELIKGALNAARAEMEALVARTAMSPFIREKKDYFTAFLNPKGELVVSTSLTLAGNLVDAILDEYPAQTMRAGDLYWYNDCYGTRGAVSHLPDMAFVMPVFHEGRLIAFAEAWGHLWDVGGSVPGSISPFATSVFQEGIMIPPVRVMREGVENEEVVRILTRNSRFPDMLRGDLKAIMAACRLGVRRLTETVERHGVDAVEAAFEAMITETEQALRARIADRIPDGEHAFRDRIDSDAVTDRSYFVDTVLRKTNGSLEIDFSASDRQAQGPINFVMDDSVPKFMLGLWMCMEQPGIGMNGGFERAVETVTTRPGTLVAPRFPAPLGLRSHTMIRVTTSLFGAIAQATGGKASAAPSVYVLYYLRGRNADGSEPLCIEGLSVGFGARTFADGIDAVYYVAQENYPIEFAEMEFGVEIEAFRIHRDSGGAGRWRGGCGIVRDVRVLSDEAVIGMRIDNCRQPAFGVNGGMSGRPGRVVVNPDGPDPRELATMSDGNRLCKGDLVRIVTPGGGGWGAPVDRPADDVLSDVLDGFVSEAAAARDYGVVLAGDEVDQAATEASRAAMARPGKMFHRGGYYDAPDDRLDSGAGA
ncbi:MAG: hydantoinase B/oxoprolinase family protein [Immundisolibacterales bacterium]|nr:hydantoinase B/oxoprolinase family protein [Immundisolibacterales bacterium]